MLQGGDAYDVGYEAKKFPARNGKGLVVEGLPNNYFFIRIRSGIGTIREIEFCHDSFQNFIFQKIMKISSRKNVIIVDPLNFLRTFSLEDIDKFVITMGYDDAEYEYHDTFHMEEVEEIYEDSFGEEDLTFFSDIAYIPISLKVDCKWMSGDAMPSKYVWTVRSLHPDSYFDGGCEFTKRNHTFFGLFSLPLDTHHRRPLSVRSKFRNFMIPLKNIFSFDTVIPVDWKTLFDDNQSQKQLYRTYVVNLRRNGVQNVDMMRNFILHGPREEELFEKEETFVVTFSRPFDCNETVKFRTRVLEYSQLLE
jgi:hypothetical protein